MSLISAVGHDVKSWLIETFGPIKTEKLLKISCFPPSYTTVRVNSCKYIENVKSELCAVMNPKKLTISNHKTLADVLVINHDKSNVIHRFEIKYSPLCKVKNDYEATASDSIAEDNVIECIIDNDPKSIKKIVIVTSACAQSVLCGAEVFVPGVKTCSRGIISGDKVCILADVRQPSILRGTRISTLTDDSISQLRFIGIGYAKMTFNTIMNEKYGVAFSVKQRIIASPPPLNNVLPNKLFLQHVTSILVGHVLNPSPEETILDMCASPGGKTSHIALLMQDRGTIIACDVSVNKVNKIRETCQRFGLSSVYPRVLNGLFSVFNRHNNETNSKVKMPTTKGLPDKERHVLIEDSSSRKQVRRDGTREENSNNKSIEKIDLIQCSKCNLYLEITCFSKRSIKKGKDYCISCTKKAKQIREETQRLSYRGVFSSHSTDSIITNPPKASSLDTRINAFKNIIPPNRTCNAAVKSFIMNTNDSTTNHCPGLPLHSFDRILLDAPCSGIGNRPRLRLDFPNIVGDKNEIRCLDSFPITQKQLIANAIQLLKPGGTLVYSTCTLSPYENEAIVAYVVSTFRSIIDLVPATPSLSGCSFGLEGYGLSEEHRLMVQRYDPTTTATSTTTTNNNNNNNNNNSDGDCDCGRSIVLGDEPPPEQWDGNAFFIAKFEKKRLLD